MIQETVAHEKPTSCDEKARCWAIITRDTLDMRAKSQRTSTNKGRAATGSVDGQAR